MTTKIFEMTGQIFRNRIKRGTTVLCSFCNKGIKIGDNVVTKSSSNKTKIRHKDCAKQVGIIN